MTRSGDDNQDPTSEDMAVSFHAAQSKEVRSPDQDGGGRARLQPRVQSALGRELRLLYDGMVSQPVPDRFVQLLDELETKETQGGDREEDS